MKTCINSGSRPTPAQCQPSSEITPRSSQVRRAGPSGRPGWPPAGSHKQLLREAQVLSLGVSCGCLASVANGLQHKQKLKQDDGGALRLVVASSPPAQSMLTCLAGPPSRAHARGVGCPSPDQHLGLPRKVQLASTHPRILTREPTPESCSQGPSRDTQRLCTRSRDAQEGAELAPGVCSRGWGQKPAPPQQRSLVRGLSQASPWDAS